MRTIRNSFGRLAVLAAAFSIGANFTLPASSYPSNTLRLSVASVSNGWVNLILHGTTPGTNYVLLSKQTLAAPSWSNAGTLTGTTNQNWTPVSVPVGAQSSYFFQAQSAAGQTTSTNLWLEIPTNGLATPGQLTVVIHNTLPDQFYDVLTNSSLAVPGLWNVQQSVFGAAGDSTTVQLPMNGPALFVRARFGVDSTGSGIPDWWWLQYFGSVGGDPFAFDPSGDGLTLWQDYWEGLNPTVFNTPPAPQGLTVSYNANTGMATVSWLPSPGTVTGYTVEDSDGNTFNFSVGTTSFTASVPHIPNGYTTGDPTIYKTYQVQAHYAGGNSVWSNPTSLENPQSFSAAIVASLNNVNLVVFGLPADTVAIRFTQVDWFATVYGDTNYNNSWDIPFGGFTNGAYSIPASWAPVVDSYGYYGSEYAWWVQAISANGGISAGSTVWSDSTFWTPINGTMLFWPAPFFDGRVQLKQDLIFLLREPDTDSPFSCFEIRSDGRTWDNIIKAPSGYVFASIYPQTNNGMADLYRPFEDNYFYRNFVFTPADSDINGNLTGMLWYCNYDYFYTGLGLQEPFVYQFQPPAGGVTTIPSLLGTNQARWLCSFRYTPAFDGNFETNDVYYDMADIGITYAFSPDGNQIIFTMVNSTTRNYFGLPIQLVTAAYQSTDSGGNSTGHLVTQTLSPGNSLTLWNVANFYPQTAQPQFQTVEYDFWIPQLDWLPGQSGFSPTNTSRLLVTSTGESSVWVYGYEGYGVFNVAAYAKLSVQNGYSGVYGYLQQYFDKAYKITNGIVTTNTTGILSPYGSFFATEPGPAALVTMPDVDPPYQRGTCTVYCVSMQVDKNSDGNMDLSFSGADATSQASPYRIWVNNWHTIPGTGGSLDYDKENRGNTSPNYAAGQIICQRDLENFFRLWICGLPVLPANQGYTVTLSMSPGSGSPAINLYDSVETNGGTGYLTDTNIAFQQCLAYAHGSSPYNVYYTGPGAPIAKITPAAPFTFPASYFTNSGNKYFLFEGACTNGSGELVLTISQNGNTIAQTGVWLDLHDIKDFYERAVITNIYNGAISNWSSTIEEVQPATSSASGNNTNLIVFVHGINVGGWDWFDDSDTVFKRLYWAGYQGKFASVKWPCHFLTPPDVWDLDVFNYSELNAYKASYAMTAYLNQLRTRFPTYRLNILAHSQGNAVVSEAIKQGAPFDTYILTQGAMPASSYDVNAPTNTSLVSQEVYHPTPEWQPMGYHGAYTNLPGRMVNFYNSQDAVLGYWVDDQQYFKPADTYSYNGTYGLKFLDPGYHLVTDSQESRAMISRSRTLPIGAQGLASGEIKEGIISSTVNLNFQFGFNGATTDEHSAQWTRPIQTSRPYYLQILKSINP
jgi:hypothetical protein